MKLSKAIFTFAMLPALAFAQQPRVISEPPAATEVDPRQAQIQAATANGIANLRDQILRTKLSRNSTVQDFLDRAQATDDLNAVLDLAQPVGGPRWVDDHVCQVRLELAGPKVSAFLISVAQDQSRHSGIKPDVLQAKLDDWKSLKFTGVGSSAQGDAVELAKPHEAAGKWSEVGDVSRRKAIAQARADAVQQAIKSIGPMLLNDKTPVSDALAHAAVSRKISGWLAAQPVTKIEFLDDLKVSVTVSIAPKSLTAELKNALASDAAFGRELTVDWPNVSRQIELLPRTFAGSATAVIEGPATTLPTVVLPLTPPEWVDQELEAEGVASAAGSSRLKVGLAAQADAVQKLRQQFLLLHVDAKNTLGEAAKGDASLNQAIDRAMKHVHTNRVDYLKDGSVSVKIGLDLRDAWDELRSGN